MATNNNTTMTFRMNKEVKDKSQQIFSALGVDMTTAINIFLRKAINVGGFPFDVRLENPNSVTYDAMDSAVNETDLYGPFDSVSDLMEALNA